MPTISADKFLECVKRSGLVEEDRLTQSLTALQEANSPALADADQLAARLVEAKLITQWHADAFLRGKSSGFFLGQYKLLGMLGAGGMSSVYLGEHTVMRCLRAIKVLPASRVNDSSYLERFKQEAMAAARLVHPNIVQAYDIAVHKQYHFIVMEYVEGRDLQNLVKEQGPLDYDQAANYIRQAAEGLAYAHESGLVHRDIKPANLLVDNRGTVKLLDLGLARFVDDKQPSLTIAHDENVLGTADYLAPEQAVDSHGADSRADIYSLGCTLYYLLTGHPPFPTGTLPQRIAAHQTKSPASIYEDRPDAPQALVDVCLRMMAKSPAARFQTAREIADTLATWLGRDRGSGKIVGGGQGRGQPGARPLPPPRRSAAAVAAPPQPSRTNDTIADSDSDTSKGSPVRRPPPRKSSSSSGNLGKDLARANEESGRGGIRSALPTARSLEARDDQEDPASVLFGLGAVVGGSKKPAPGRTRSSSGNRRPSQLKLPKWGVYAIVAGAVVSFVAFVVLVVMEFSKESAGPGDQPKDGTSIRGPGQPGPAKPSSTASTRS